MVDLTRLKAGLQKKQKMVGQELAGSGSQLENLVALLVNWCLLLLVLVVRPIGFVEQSLKMM